MKEPLKKFSDFQFESIYKCVSSVPAKKHAGYVIIDDKLHQPDIKNSKIFMVSFSFTEEVNPFFYLLFCFVFLVIIVKKEKK